MENTKIYFTVPQWAVDYLTTSAWGNLNTQQLNTLNDFTNRMLDLHGSCVFYLDENPVLGLMPVNDVDSTESQCFKVYVRPRKKETAINLKLDSHESYNAWYNGLEKSLVENAIATYYSLSEVHMVWDCLNLDEKTEFYVFMQLFYLTNESE